MREIRALAFGGGVQSTALLLLSASGAIPRFDRALFADTGWEREATLRHIERVNAFLAEAFPDHPRVEIVRSGLPPLREVLSRPNGSLFIPAYTAGPDGRVGRLRRSCTERYKIRPVLARLLGEASRVRLALGISLDEAERMRRSDDPRVVPEYPLVDLRLTRADCERICAAFGLRPPKSACVGCPFRSDVAWRDLAPWERAEAIEIDEAIRDARPPFRLYLHRSGRPLREVFAILDRQPALPGMEMAEEECGGWCLT